MTHKTRGCNKMMVVLNHKMLVWLVTWQKKIIGTLLP